MSASKTTDGTGKDFVVTRTFDAPRDLVWKAWSEPERLAQWWGPKNCPIRISACEFRPGGLFLYSMTMGDATWWGRFVYREIEKPARLIFVNSFSNEKGDITRAPFSATWPLEILNHLTLSEQGDKTVLVLRGSPINPTDEESATFEGMFASLQQGFGGTFDQLEDYLAKANTP